MSTKTLVKPKVSVKNLLAQLRSNLTIFADAIQTIGQLVVELIDVHKFTPKEIADKLDVANIGEDEIANMARVGRNQLHPRLLAADYAAAGALRWLTIEDQTQVLEAEVVDVVTLGPKDEPVTQTIKLSNLNPVQVAQVFNVPRLSNGRFASIRDAAAQVAWIEEQKTKRAIKQAGKQSSAPWEIVNGNLIISKAPLVIPLHELKKAIDAVPVVRKKRKK